MTEASFGQWGQHFQKKILQALLVDPQWAEQMTEVLEPRYFELKYLEYLADRYLNYARKYKAYPTLQLLVAIVKDELKQGTDIALREQVIDYLKAMRAAPDMGDLPLVKDKALDFCRRQALKKALEKTVELIETEKYEAIVDTIKHAVSAGTTSGLGHDLFEDVEARYVTMKRSTIPTGIPEIDAPKVFNGGSETVPDSYIS
jgi:DNA-dependent RNA polymerase auxiliary subunit epsilon